MKADSHLLPAEVTSEAIEIPGDGDAVGGHLAHDYLQQVGAAIDFA